MKLNSWLFYLNKKIIVRIKSTQDNCIPTIAKQDFGIFLFSCHCEENTLLAEDDAL